MKCPKCGSRDIDFQESIGQSICVNCGTVVEENAIVSSIEFQESGDRSHVVGQYISASAGKPYSGGRPMGGHGENRDPRDATLVNARRTISQVAGSLRLPPLYIDRAYRLYQLALQRNFIFGRKQLHVVATCLYIICRQEKSPHLLIDFSDALQINVYVLGKSFLQFSKVLNLNLPVVDPSLYIHRYATRLDLGESRAQVVATSLRIITRLKKDWITTGRRPDGICALAMLVAARAHDFDVNQDVICKLFRVSPDLLRRRIDDFKSIPSAQLTLEQFHTNDAEVEFDPPSYIRSVVEHAHGTGGTSVSQGGLNDNNSVDTDRSSAKRVRLALPRDTSASEHALLHNSHATSALHHHRYSHLRADASVNVLVAAANIELGRSRGLVKSSLRRSKRGAGGAGGESTSDSEGGGSSDEGGDNDILRGGDNLEQDEVYNAGAYSSDEDNMYGARPQSAFFKTKIADINIVVPIPGQKRRRRQTEAFHAKLQQRKELYEEVYNEVREGCELTASSEVLEALQREAQQIEDAVDNVGGWGEASQQQTRIKERRIVLCLDDKGTTYKPPTGRASSGAPGGGSSSAAPEGKLKFRRLNNGADASLAASALASIKTDTSASIAGTTAGSASSAAKTGTASTPAADKEGDKDATTAAATIEEEEALLGEDPDDVLGGEAGRYLLSEEEQRKRSLIWEKAFRPFMDERESRRKAREREMVNNNTSEKYTQSGKLRRKYTRKALEAAKNGTPGATTTSQAVMAAQQNKSSKKINYDALKGVFDADGSFATPAAPSSAHHHAAASSAAGGASSASASGSAFDTMGTAGLLGNGNQAYLDSLLGLSQASSAVAGAYGAGSSGGSGFSKDVRNTVLGSSIAKTSQRGQRRMLNPGNAVSTGSASTRSAKLGPAVSSASASAVGIPAAPAAGSSSSSNAPSAVAAANAAAAATSAAYNEDLGEGDEGEDDQLLYEGGNGDDDGYDDYEDEYY